MSGLFSALGPFWAWIGHIFDPLCGPAGLFTWFGSSTILACGDTGWGDEIAAGLKAIIKSMMQAQLEAETNTDGVLKELVGKYYKTSMENAKIAQGKQPAVVDARSQTDFILQRTDSVMEMGYIKKKPGRDAIDWTLLEEVIKENPDLYGKLKYKSAA